MKLPHLPLALTLLLACGPSNVCPDASMRVGDRCLAVPGDAGTDAGPPDAGRDAGPCGMTCPVAIPVCDATSGTCVACLGAGDCASPTALCDTTANECVACLADTDCTDQVCNTTTNECVQCNTSSDCPPDAPRCTMGSCEAGCTDTLCADNFADRAPVCAFDTGGCVACLPDENEGLRCGGMSCDPSTRTCTTTPLGRTELCEPCVRSTECDTHRTETMACVETFFDGSVDPIGSYCLVRRVPIEVSCPRGTPVRVTRAPVDESTEAIYCAPVTNTTCPAVFSLQGCTPSDASPCGSPMLDDAVCSEERCRSRCVISEPASCGITGESCRMDPGGPSFCIR